jgi:hypothetical protein
MPLVKQLVVYGVGSRVNSIKPIFQEWFERQTSIVNMKKIRFLLVFSAVLKIAYAGPYKGVEVSTDGGMVGYYDSSVRKIVLIQQSLDKITTIDVSRRVFACFIHQEQVVGISYDGILYVYKNNNLVVTKKIEASDGVLSYCESSEKGFFYLLLKSAGVYKLVKYGVTDRDVEKFGESILNKGPGSLVLRNKQVWLLGTDFADKIE